MKELKDLQSCILCILLCQYGFKSCILVCIAKTFFSVFCIFCLFCLEFNIILVAVLCNICVIIVYIGFKCSVISFRTIKLLVLTFCKNRKIMLEKTCFQRGFEFFENISYIEKLGRSTKSIGFIQLI